MFDMNFINDMAKRLSESVPPNLKKCQHELEKNFRVVLQTIFAKLELVTREEFNVQKGVLAKTRAKITLLEKQVTQLEKHFPRPKVKKRSQSS